jgi:RNA polymerase sigma-70 factor, ECF subfamily
VSLLMSSMDPLSEIVVKAQSGDLEAYGRLVRETQSMVFGVLSAILRDPAAVEDAVQELYLRTFRRLNDLAEPAAFPGWLRRIAITVAINVRRARRTTLLRLDDLPELPILDEQEATWSDAQRTRLSAALLTLTSEERRLCDRRYYGQWTLARLAADAGVDEPVLRKRMQRIRDKLRREMEMREQENTQRGSIAPELPAKILELLARPCLIDLPENPVGRTTEIVRPVFSAFTDIDIPDVLSMTEIRGKISEAVYVDEAEMHRLDADRILRYDLTLPLLLTVRYANKPLRCWAAGKVYRACHSDSTHLEAFHQGEALWVDDRAEVDVWRFTGQVLQSVNALLPGSTMRIVPTSYPMCKEAWELDVERNGDWTEVLAWGVFTDKIVSHLGADPSRVTAVGAGFGLERLAMLRFGIDDMRKLEVASV